MEEDIANKDAEDEEVSIKHHIDLLNTTVQGLKGSKMDIEALECLEQSLWLKRKTFGTENSGVIKVFREVVLMANSIAMNALAASEFEKCLSLLRKAEALTNPGNFQANPSLRVLTLNNLGCCFRRFGKLKVALKYLKEAAKLGAQSSSVLNLSLTHLNICAILSQLGRHASALEHAQTAVFHCQEELVNLEIANDDGEDSEFQQDVIEAKSKKEKIVTLGIAYYNLAVELEYTGKKTSSLQWYKKALQLIKKYRKDNENLYVSFKETYNNAKKKINFRKSNKNNKNGDTSFVPQRPSSKPRVHKDPPIRKNKRHSDNNTNAEVVWYDSMRPATQLPYENQVLCGRIRAKRKSTEGKKAKKNQSNIFQGSPVRAALRSKEVFPAGHENIKVHGTFSRRNPPRISIDTTLVDSINRSVYKNQKENCAHENNQANHVFVEEDDDDVLEYFGGQDAESKDDGKKSKLRVEKIVSETRNNESNDHVVNAKDVNYSESYGLHSNIDDPPLGVLLNWPENMNEADYLKFVRSAAQKLSQENSISCSKSTETKMLQASPRQIYEDDSIYDFSPVKENVNSVRNSASDLIPLDMSKSKATENSAFFRKISDEGGDSLDIELCTIPKNVSSNVHTVNSIQQSPEIDSSSDLKKSDKVVVNTNRYANEVEAIHEIASTRISAWFRGVIVRKNDKLQDKFDTEIMQRKDNAARIIQKRHRHRKLRRDTEMEISLAFEKMNIAEFAATMIQSVCRSYQVRCFLRNEKLRQNNIIQMQKEQAEHTASSIIQSLVRSYLTRKRIHCKFASDLSRKLLLRMHINIEMINAEKNQDSYHIYFKNLEEYQSAQKIQAIVRGNQLRLYSEACFAGESAAATNIQSGFRGYLVRKNIHPKGFIKELKEKYESEDIQQMDIVHEIAAKTIQSNFRKYLANAHLVTISYSENEKNAAIKLQKKWKKYSSHRPRGPVQSDNDNETNTKPTVFNIAASVLQNAWKRYLNACKEHEVVLKMEDEMLAQQEAAMCIQALARGHMSRNSIRELALQPQFDHLPSTQTNAASQLSLFDGTESACSTLNDYSMNHSPNTERSFSGASSDSFSNGFDNDSFLPADVHYFFTAFQNSHLYKEQFGKTSIDLNLLEELNLGYASFLEEFDEATSPDNVAAAADALRVIIHGDHSLQTIKEMVTIAFMIDKKIQDPEIWQEDVAVCCGWLLDEFNHLLGQ